jgi:transcriptional regulator with XRE-family HTH domain
MKNLKRIREKKGMTQEELAFKSQVKYGTLISYETGKRVATLERAARIAEVLGVPIEDLRK